MQNSIDDDGLFDSNVAYAIRGTYLLHVANILQWLLRLFTDMSGQIGRTGKVGSVPVLAP